MKIYVKLLNESVDVWRPVDADEHYGLYRITSHNYNDDEDWEFNFNDSVICKKHKFADESKGLIATEKK